MVVQTLAVYIMLGGVFVSLCRYYTHFPKGRHNYLLWALVVFSIVFGIRYGVGADYIGYKDTYEYELNWGKTDTHMETGFMFIMRTCSALGLHYAFFFGVVAFMQVYFLFKGLRRDIGVLSYMAYTFMASCSWLEYSNGMRQELAFCIFVYSLPFIQDRKWIAYYLCNLLAILMHTSAVLLLICYPLFAYKQEWFRNVKLQLLLLSASLLLLNYNVVFDIVSLIDIYIAMTPYASYVDMTSERILEKLSTDISLGIGFVIATIIIFIQVCYSNKVKRYFNSRCLSIAYDMFFVGVLWRHIFVGSQIFQRVNYYLYGFSFIIGAYTLAYMYVKSRKMFCILTLFYFLIFVGYMSNVHNNDSMFYFFWQKEQYVPPVK